MYKHLEGILKCPISGLILEVMDDNSLENANALIRNGEITRCNGESVKQDLDSALISSNGKYIYPIEKDIIFLLRDSAVIVQDQGSIDIGSNDLGKEKKTVIEFYDRIGWRKFDQDLFVDAARFEDLRPVSKDYINKCHLRINNYLKATGQYFLDVASGSIQFPEYLSYSKNFEYRICVDISVQALNEARETLGNRGIYLLADITNLPLTSNLVDSVISLHTIYHVPAEEQEKAFSEVYRVLKPGGQGVVVYTWGKNSSLMNIAFFPRRVIKGVNRRLKEMQRIGQAEKPNPKSSSSEPDLYFFAHSPRWFDKQINGKYVFETVVWRSVSVDFLKTYIHKYLFGKQILTVIYWSENKMPHFFGRFGQYPLFILKKNINV